MTFLLVPHGVTDSTATIWVGAIDEDTRTKSVRLEYGSDRGDSGMIELDRRGWLPWQSYHRTDRGSYLPWDWVLAASLPKIRRLHYQRVGVGSLESRTTYSFKLLIDGQAAVGAERHLREGRATTLSASLPSRERPFTLLLGSCFYGPRDPEGLVGATYQHLPENERPEIKVLCGDQVYLDNPWRETTFGWYYAFRQPGFFRAMLFGKYEDNWRQIRGEDAGFRQLLRDGANYFCSDDHEFWNNAPNFGGVGLFNTLTRRQRRWWFREARRLFQAFQSPSPLMRFDIGQLSFCIADTRINRDTKGRRFMNAYDLQLVGDWIDKLNGPGVLVIGQPLLVRKSGVVQTVLDKGLREGLREVVWRSVDKSLPDYAQYDELIGHIKSSKRSVVVLTGDVHFGRITHGWLNGESEAKFVEVISSPQQVVLGAKDEEVFGRYEAAPTKHFLNLTSIKAADHENHFATVRFYSSEGGVVNMEVRYWPIRRPKDGVPLKSIVEWKVTLP